MGWVKGKAGKWRGGRIWKAPETGVKTYVIRRQVRGVRYEVSTGCTTQASALEHLTRFEANPAGYTPGPSLDSLVRLDDAQVDAYIKWSEGRDDVPETIRRKKRHLKWWRTILGSRDLRYVKTKEVLDALDDMSGRSLRLATIKGLYGWLVREARTVKPSEDPTSVLKVERGSPAQNQGKSKVVSREDFDATMAKLGDRWKPLVELGWYTGWHGSELQRFIENGEIHPFPEARPDGTTHRLLCPRHKHGGIHQSAVSAEVAAIAQKVRDLGPYDRNSLWKNVQKACKDAGLEKPWNTSWLRHSLASRVIAAGATVDQASDYLGHRDKRTTLAFYAVHGVVQRPVGI